MAEENIAELSRLFHFERDGRCSADLPGCCVQELVGAAVGVIDVAAVDAFEVLRAHVRGLAAGGSMSTRRPLVARPTDTT